MKKSLFSIVAGCCLMSCNNQAQQKSTSLNSSIDKNQKVMTETIYQFKVTDLEGNEFDFSDLKGKKIMVVNTASKCGLTPQYKDLEAIYKKYQDKNFVIVGFPANNFGSQEPGTNQEIITFCQRNYGVTFPMMAKVSVVGNDMCEMYQFLTQKSRNGIEDSEVAWNFQKYLINENGQLEKVLSPRVLPTDQSIIDWIEK
jgi:glutathione peroxidase